MSSNAPRETRSSVILYARIEAGDRAADVRVRNLSASGACVDSPGELAVGDSLSVTMGTLERLPAEVMWVSNSLAGLHFTAGLIDIAEARKPRPRDGAQPGGSKARAGWMENLHHAYRRSG